MGRAKLARSPILHESVPFTPRERLRAPIGAEEADHAPRSIDARLDWLIASSGITNREPRRRLNAIENQIAGLGARWRAIAPIDPSRELRMSAVTRDQLLAWVEQWQEAHWGAVRKIGSYALSAADSAVKDGWIRLVFEKPLP